MKYGKTVKFWLGPLGPLWVSHSDPDDICQVNKLAKGRPEVTKMLLPFLGDSNLLFQPVEADDGKFVKMLRLKYGKMVSGSLATRNVHDVSLSVLSKRTKAGNWGSGKAVNVFEELKAILYDIMGTAMFGQEAWHRNDNFQRIFRLHRYLLEWNAQLGFKVLKEFTTKNALSIASDYMEYQGAIKELHSICSEMIATRQEEVGINPKAWEGDKTALTMLVTEKDKSGKPFFDKDLAIATMCGFLNGAYDTTHSTLFWILYHLATHPDVQERLAGDLVARLGKSDNISFDVLNRTDDLLHATIQESIRLRPTVQINFRKYFGPGDMLVGGYEIPREADLYQYIEGAMRDEAKFGDEGAPADVFSPDRFMGSSAKVKARRLAFTGFGSHSRMCPGLKFAEAELKAMITFLLTRWHISLAKGAKPPGAIYESGCQIPAKPCDFCFMARE